MGNRNKEQGENQKTNNKCRNPAIPVITLNINCLNIPNKRQRLPNWFKKNTCCLKKPTLNVKIYLS